MNDFSLSLPAHGLGKSSIRLHSNDILITDVRALNRRLREIDPELRKQLVRDAKDVGRQAESVIKSAIPSVSPLRVTNSSGRFVWNAQIDSKGRSMPANKTSVQFRTSGSGRASTTSLVAVKVLAPMTVIADIAGRSGRSVNAGYRNSGYTRPFMRNGVQVRMRLNGQGIGMIRKLGGHASRYAWPALENDKPRLQLEVQQIIDRYTVIANRGFN